MVLQPKNLLLKFGYNYPVGLFIDSSQERTMKNAVKKSDLELFQKFLNQHKNVKSLNEWFGSQNNLTIEEITNIWAKNANGEIPKNIEAARLIKITQLRTMHEATALHNIDDNNAGFLI